MILSVNSNKPLSWKIAYCFIKAFRQQLENDNVPKINNTKHTSSLSIRGSDILFRPLVGKRHFW